MTDSNNGRPPPLPEVGAPKRTRKVIQIVFHPESEKRFPGILALCSDGTMWGAFVRGRASILDGHLGWSQIKNVPQPYQEEK